MKKITISVRTLIALMVGLLVGGAMPAMAVAYDANNAKAVDGLSAVKSTATAAARKGKLVATSSTTGKFPASVMSKAPDSKKLGGQLPAAYTLDSEFLSLLPPDLADGDDTGGPASDVTCAGPCVDAGEISDGAVDVAQLAFDPATQGELDAVQTALGDTQTALTTLTNDFNNLVGNLSSAGTINDGGNPVDWTKLKNVPGDIADGVDDDTNNVPAAEFTSGFGAVVPTAIGFIGPTVSVATQAGDEIFVNSTKALGASTNPAGDLNLYICYQNTAPGSPVNTVGGGMLGLMSPPNTRLPYNLSAVIAGLPEGTYSVGLCGASPSDAADWNNNEWGYTSAMVFR